VSIRRAALLAAALAALTIVASGGASLRAAAPKVSSLRLYVIDCGVIKGLGVDLFGFKAGEVPARDFFVPCYLIAHPRGTLMWEVGVLPDSAFKGGTAPVTERASTVTRPLLPQLAALGYTPADITYLGLSHYHSDHTANANAFAKSTWLVRKIERDAMFAEKPAGIIEQATFSALKDARTVLLEKDEHDVFGDGTVIIKSAPGHTPGHQVLFLKLKKTGPLLVAGDLYHYPEEQTMNRFPSFEFSKEQSAVSRANIDAFVKMTKAQMWIEHDAATNAKLKKAPEFYD
jgi:glyoxylase-like metal-dependent hydrolase (beta-lactamase superfamily II)